MLKIRFLIIPFKVNFREYGLVVDSDSVSVQLLRRAVNLDKLS